MFTGIIESKGIIQSIESKGTNLSFWIQSPISPELKPDQSLAHNGVCLTVEDIKGSSHKVTAIQETLDKTSMSKWITGDEVNLERCLQMNGRLDGHIVQGHVDTVGICTAKLNKNGSTEFSFKIDPSFSGLIIEKGSISLNGISLTIFNVSRCEFTVAIIPYTMEYTNMNSIHEGSGVNIEFDMIGKYVNRQRAL
jgi:riboflavin synthase